jgi:threonine aldolase
LRVDLAHVQTNMVVVETSGLGVDDGIFVSRLKEKGVLAGAIGKGKVRFVTHWGIEREHVEAALDAIGNVVGDLSA